MRAPWRERLRERICSILRHRPHGEPTPYGYRDCSRCGHAVAPTDPENWLTAKQGFGHITIGESKVTTDRNVPGPDTIYLIDDRYIEHPDKDVILGYPLQSKRGDEGT